MSNFLQIRKLKDLTFIEEQNNNPTFTWQGNVYAFDPSITEFNRELETGGFQLVRLMTATVRLYNVDCHDNLTAIFPNGYPQPQQKITYTLDGNTYRIESVKPEKTGAYIRIVAHSATKI